MGVDRVAGSATFSNKRVIPVLSSALPFGRRTARTEDVPAGGLPGEARSASEKLEAPLLHVPRRRAHVQEEPPRSHEDHQARRSHQRAVLGRREARVLCAPGLRSRTVPVGGHRGRSDRVVQRVCRLRATAADEPRVHAPHVQAQPGSDPRVQLRVLKRLRSQVLYVYIARLRMDRQSRAECVCNSERTSCRRKASTLLLIYESCFQCTPNEFASILWSSCRLA